MAQSLVSMGLTLYMWRSAKTFGLLSECSYLVKYIFFVVEVQATSVGQIVGLVITSLLTAIYLLITLQELYTYCQSYAGDLQRIPPKHSGKLSLAFPLPPGSTVSYVPSVHAASLSLTNEESSAPRPRHNTYSSNSAQSSIKIKSTVAKRRPKRRRWSLDLDPMLVGIIICQVLVFTYFVVSTELLLQRNPSNDGSTGQWSFGQILALIVVIPSA
ncbi:hypothetical protein E4T56_gene13694, partial [Termitomyces sp. T112]